MTLTTRTVTNAGDPLCAPDGTPLAGITITFTLSNARGLPIDAWDSSTGERVTGIKTAITDASGEFSVALWPTDRSNTPVQYLCRASLPSVRNFMASLPSGDSVFSWGQLLASGLPLTAQQLDILDTYRAGFDAAAAAAAENAAKALAIFGDAADVAAAVGSVSADAEQVARDKQSANEDRLQTGWDRTATGQDKDATAADRLQTGLDRDSAADSALLAAENGAGQVALAAEQVSLAAEQAGLATSNGAAQVVLAADQAGISTTKAGQASDSAAAALATQADIQTNWSDKLATAATQAGIATTGAGTATAQAVISTTQAGLAATAKTQAEAAQALSQAAAAASAVALAAKDTIAIGLASVADTQAFWVRPNSTDGLTRYTHYRRDSATTYTLIGSLALGAEFDALVATLYKVGKNKFNKGMAFIANSRINATTGLPQFSGGWTEMVSDFFAILPNTTYAFNSVSNLPIAQYTANKAFIGLTTVTKAAPLATGATAAFARVQTYAADIAALQIEIGASYSAYENYTVLFDSSLLNTVTLLARPEIVAALAMLEPGKNKFNPAQVFIAEGRLTTNGDLSTNPNPGRQLTDFIEVSPSTQYSTNTGFTFAVYEYDADKRYIKQGTTYNLAPFTTTASTKYVRYLMYDVHTTTELYTLQIEKGAAFTFYEPYSLGFRGPLDASAVRAALKWANNALAMPSRQYFLANQQNSIYYQAIQRRYIPDLFYTRITGGATQNRLREARLTPTAAATLALTASLYDGEFDVVSTKSVSATIASNTTPSTAIKVLAIGDSQTFEGTWLGKVQSVIPAITTLGIRAGALTTSVMHEGRSGWTLANLFSRFGNFGFDGFTPFMHPVGQRFMGTTRTWLAVAATPTLADVVGMTAIYATLAPDASGRPTKDPASGVLAAGAVIYNNAAASYQLWNGSAWGNIAAPTFVFNFAQYLATFGVQTPDAVTMMLGTNDFGTLAPRAVAAAFVTFKTQLDTLIASAFAAGVTKFGLMLPPSTLGPMEDAGGTKFTRMQDAALWEARNLMINTYDNRTGEGIYIIDAGSALDPEYGFAFGTAEKPFAEYSGTETIKPGFNLPHPSPDGYGQIGIRVAAWIQSVR